MNLRVLILTAWALAVVVIVGHGVAGRIGEFLFAFQGPAVSTNHLFAHWVAVIAGLVWLGVFWLVAGGKGILFMSWFGRPREAATRGMRLLLFLVGFGIHGCVVVALGLLGLFFPLFAGIHMILFGICGAWLLSRSRLFHPEKTVVPEDGRWLKWPVLAAFILLGLFSLTPETWIDSLAYHLAAPQDFNKLHKWVDIHQDTYRYPLFPEGIYGQAMLVGGEKLAMMLNLSGTVLAMWLLWEWAGQIAGAMAGWLALLALLTSDQVGFHIGQTNQGMYSVGYACMGVWAWLFAFQARAPTRWAFLAGMGLGWALCAKYTSAVPLLGITVWHLFRFPRNPRRESVVLSLVLLGAAISSAPFLVNGWLFTGNPVYPLFFGGIDWTEENTRMLRLFGCVGYDIKWDDLGSFFRSFLRLLTEEQPLLLLALPAVVLLRSTYWLAFGIVWLVSFVAWTVGVPCLRLMMPAYPALSLVSAILVVAFLKKGGAIRVVTAIATCVVLGFGFVETVAATDMHKKSFRAAVGLESEKSYLTRILTTYKEAVHEVGKFVSPRGRILVIGDNRGYLFSSLALNRDIEDTPAMLELSREARDADDIRRRLRQMEVHYVLLNYGLIAVTSG